MCIEPKQLCPCRNVLVLLPCHPPLIPPRSLGLTGAELCSLKRLAMVGSVPERGLMEQPSALLLGTLTISPDVADELLGFCSCRNVFIMKRPDESVWPAPSKIF